MRSRSAATGIVASRSRAASPAVSGSAFRSATRRHTWVGRPTTSTTACACNAYLRARELYGRVTKRGCSRAVCGTGQTDANGPLDGVYTSGTTGVGGATVAVSGFGSVPTDMNGNWSLPSATGGPLVVTVTPPAAVPASKAIAINVNVPPGSGVRVDTPLEEPFTAFNNTGISYTTYIDYARGRLLLHTLKINPATSVVAVDRSPINSFLARKCQSPYTIQTRSSIAEFKTLLATASQVGALAMINSIWWDPCTAESVGYLYSTSGYKPINAVVWCDVGSLPSGTQNCVNSAIYLSETGAALFPQNNMPLFTVKGTSTDRVLNSCKSRQLLGAAVYPVEHDIKSVHPDLGYVAAQPCERHRLCVPDR